MPVTKDDWLNPEVELTWEVEWPWVVHLGDVVYYGLRGYGVTVSLVWGRCLLGVEFQ
jgi:hypothetical protein